VVLYQKSRVITRNNLENSETETEKIFLYPGDEGIRNKQISSTKKYNKITFFSANSFGALV